MLTALSGCQHFESQVKTASPLSWEKLPAIPDPEGFAGAFAGVSHGALITAGGANIVGDKWGDKFQKVWYDSVFVLERPDGTWKTGFKLPRALGYGVSISTKTGVICIGGSDSAQHYADVFQMVWQNGTLQFTSLPSLPKPCANFCGANIGDTIYVAGGLETPTSTNTLKTFWKLDLAAKNPHWEELESWPGASRMLAVTGVADGAFYLFSGAELLPDANGKPVRTYLNDAYRYTPGKGWEKLPNLPRATVAAPSPAVVKDGHLLLFSGDDGTKVSFQPVSQHPGFSHETLAFDVKKNSWSVEEEVPFSRATAPVVEWQNHIVVVNGEARPRARTPEVWQAKLPSSK